MGKWPNTYVFTKAIAEDIVKTVGKDLPIAIVRPSISNYYFSITDQVLYFMCCNIFDSDSCS